MSILEDWDEADWRELFAEFRLIIAASGFAAWDLSMADALDEETDGAERRPLDGRYAVVRYAKSFLDFLDVRSAANLRRLQAELGDFLTDGEGRPVRAAIVAGDIDPAIDLLSISPTATSDALAAEIKAFLAAISGDDPGYFEELDA